MLSKKDLEYINKEHTKIVDGILDDVEMMLIGDEVLFRQGDFTLAPSKMVSDISQFFVDVVFSDIMEKSSSKDKANVIEIVFNKTTSMIGDAIQERLANRDFKFFRECEPEGIVNVKVSLPMVSKNDSGECNCDKCRDKRSEISGNIKYN